MLTLTAVLAGLSRQGKIICRFSELRDGLLNAGHSLPGSYQGWMKQLSKMGPAVLFRTLELLRPVMIKRCGKLWHMCGWVPIAVDGSRFDLPHTQNNKKTYGTAGRTGCGPQMWVTLLSHLTTGLVWSWRQGSSYDSERRHLCQMLEELPDDVLLIGDAGFIGYDLAAELCRRGKAFLLRVGGNKTLLTQMARSEIENSPSGVKIIYWTGQAVRSGLIPLTLRLIVVGSGKKKVYLLTNVFDPQKLSRSMAGEFYRLRWGIEVTYRSVKQVMQRRKLRCGNADNAAVELAGNIMGLVVLGLMGVFILKHKADRLSVAAALECVHNGLEAMRWGMCWKDFVKYFRQALKDNYSRHGPKSYGRYPQKKIQKPPSPPRLRPMTEKELQLFIKLKKEIQKTG